MSVQAVKCRKTLKFVCFPNILVMLSKKQNQRRIYLYQKDFNRLFHPDSSEQTLQNEKYFYIKRKLGIRIKTTA